MASVRDEEYEELVEYGCSPCDCPSLTQQRISVLIEELMLHCKTRNSLRLTIDFQTFVFVSFFPVLCIFVSICSAIKKSSVNKDMKNDVNAEKANTLFAELIRISRL